MDTIDDLPGPDSLATIEGDAGSGVLDTILDDAPPAGLHGPTLPDLLVSPGVSAAYAAPLPVTGPEPLTPPPILTQTVDRRRHLRNIVAIGLAGAAIVLIFLLVALTAYLASA